MSTTSNTYANQRFLAAICLAVLAGVPGCSSEGGSPAVDASPTDDASTLADASNAPIDGPDGSGGTDASGGTDGSTSGGVEACYAEWGGPLESDVTAVRPDPGLYDTMRMTIQYDLPTFTLSSMQGFNGVVPPSDGPFMPGVHAGSWWELQNAAGQTLYTKIVYEMFPTSTEGVSEDGTFIRVPACERTGLVSLRDAPNLAGATHLVLFSSPVDFERQGEAASEVVRFTLE